MKHKVIFLDIDGVLNTVMIDIKPFGNEHERNKDGFYIDLCSPSDDRVSNRQAVMWLNKLCKETGASIVISSTWRFSGLDHTINCLRNSGLFDDIVIEGETPRLPYGKRGDEIRAYLSEHPDIDDFIILDDDADMCEFADKLVRTHTFVGFTMKEYLEASKMLEG